MTETTFTKIENLNYLISNQNDPLIVVTREEGKQYEFLIRLLAGVKDALATYGCKFIGIKEVVKESYYPTPARLLVGGMTSDLEIKHFYFDLTPIDVL